MKIAFALVVLLVLATIGYFEKQHTKPTATTLNDNSSEQPVAIPVNNNEGAGPPQ